MRRTRLQCASPSGLPSCTASKPGGGQPGRSTVASCIGFMGRHAACHVHVSESAQYLPPGRVGNVQNCDLVLLLICPCQGSTGANEPRPIVVAHPCSTHQLWEALCADHSQRGPQAVPCQEQALAPCEVSMPQQREHVLNGVVLPGQWRAVVHFYLEMTTCRRLTASGCTTQPPRLLCQERSLCTNTAPHGRHWAPAGGLRP